MAAVTTGVEAIGSFPSLDEFTAPAHQEQECVERVQQHTVEQIVHVPQIHEQIVEGVKEFPQERLPQQTVEQIENATPVPVIEFVAPAPVVEYIAPALPVTISWGQSAVTSTLHYGQLRSGEPAMLHHSCGDSAPQIIGSFSPVNEFAAPVHQEQLVAEQTTQNAMENPIPSSTSTNSDRDGELANMLNSCIEQHTPLAALVKASRRIAMLTKRMMEPEQVPWKRRRRTRYIRMPGIMENATYLAPSAWPPTRRA